MSSLTDLVTHKFENNILDGMWSPGDYIPSSRVLAEREGVSRGVITAAISILVGKGYLERVPRHGIKVCEKFRKTDIDKIMDVAANKDVNLAREYARKCMNILNERSQDNNNLFIDEDINMLYQCFGEALDSVAYKEKQSYKEEYSDIDRTLYLKGLRCAGYSPEKYTLYQCNLTRDVSDLCRGELLGFEFDKNDITFDDRTMDYVEKRVHPNDSATYLSFVKKKKFLEDIVTGEKHYSFEYRERKDKEYRWNKLSMNLSKDDKGDVILLLLYLDIDSDKRNEILQKELSEEDTLTGALNRRAFILQSEQILSKSDDSVQHAFLMIDIDGFKTVNDLFGHPVGDTVLSDIAKAIRSVLRQGDILGRIGGDEFMVCMTGVPFDAIIEKRANQIRSLIKHKFENGALISGSIGVAIYPRDGDNFVELYKKTDIALYNAKDNGNDRVEFFTEGMIRHDFYEEYMETTGTDSKVIDTIMKNENSDSELEDKHIEVKKKVLVVDDNDVNRELLSGLLSDEYIPLQTKDGKRALMTLKRYGNNISAVLLDLIMPGMDGFEVLQAMQRDSVLKTIPVIIVSGATNDDSEYRAIELGAVDFIPKPVEPRLLKLRVRNAVNKKENDRLRIQNSYFQFQEDEEAKYRFVVQCTGILLIEHDWVNSIFVYDKMLPQVLAGKYDHRSLWRILLSDMVASSMTVKDMQGLIYRLANDRKAISDSIWIQLKTKSGEKHWFDMSVFKQSDGLQITNKLIITLRDINDEVISQDKLRFMAEYDSLTKLYNRTLFLDKADEKIKSSKPSKWELCIMDIDGFKVFNHLYGHSAGDHLLTYIAGVMKTILAKYSGLCGRIQSDVFAFLQSSDYNGVDKVLDELGQAIDKYSGGKKITMCTGRYIVSEPALTINAILDRAVIAHALAKKNKNNSLLFSNDMQKKLLMEQEIVSSMELALRDNQFEVFFQPIYDYSTGKIITAEALVRWRHPLNGMISPNDFIPLFEQNGFIYNMDSYVWDKTCYYINKWRKKGIEILPISVNVSRIDIYEQNFIPKLVTTMKKYDISFDLLRLEITESACVENHEYIIEMVEKLKKCGFLVEMDDFGSGFSSLNILSEVPVDILKLDMKFISSENRTGKKDKIMGHIIGMAKSTDIDVIAEGVESLEQAELLSGLGCNIMQGFYFSKPVDNETFEELLMNNQL